MNKLKELAKNNSFGLFITGVVALSVVLTVFSVVIYYKTGAYQLDLSRPEYESRRAEIVENGKENDEFKAQGAIDEKALQEFLKLYDKESNSIVKMKPFVSDVLSDKELGLGE